MKKKSIKSSDQNCSTTSTSISVAEHSAREQRGLEPSLQGGVALSPSNTGTEPSQQTLELLGQPPRPPPPPRPPLLGVLPSAQVLGLPEPSAQGGVDLGYQLLV